MSVWSAPTRALANEEIVDRCWHPHFTSGRIPAFRALSGEAADVHDVRIANVGRLM